MVYLGNPEPTKVRSVLFGWNLPYQAASTTCRRHSGYRLILTLELGLEYSPRHVRDTCTNRLKSPRSGESQTSIPCPYVSYTSQDPDMPQSPMRLRIRLLTRQA